MLNITMTIVPGRTTEGILLAINQESARIALPGADDVLELRRVEGRWLTEDNAAVEFDALITDGRTDPARLAGIFPRVFTAGYAQTA